MERAQVRETCDVRGLVTVQLRDLAKSGTAEAIYFDITPTGDQALGYPSIAFVVKGKLNELAPRQSDAIQNLWRAGVVENVYFDAVDDLSERVRKVWGALRVV